MHSNEKLILVVPSVNEAQNLKLLLPRICSALTPCAVPYEVVVVDDESGDGTEDVVTTVARAHPQVRFLERKGERGLAGAILYGWQQSDATILGVMDADLQHPPELLPELLREALKGKDVVLGSRYAKGGDVGVWNPFRRVLSVAAVWVTLPLQHSGLRVHDPMSGYFLVRRRCVEKVIFQPNGFKLLLEILVRGHVRSVREVPFVFGRRRNGSSKACMKVAWEYLQLLARLYAIRWGGKRAVEIAAGD